jgi:hypothetical protein
MKSFIPPPTPCSTTVSIRAEMLAAVRVAVPR